MELTDFQKQVIKFILERKVFDIKSFFIHTPELVKAERFDVPSFYLINNNKKILFKTHSYVFTYKTLEEEKVKNAFLEFIALWDALDDNYIITTALDESVKQFMPVISDETVKALNISFNRVLEVALSKEPYVSYIKSMDNYSSNVDYKEVFLMNYRTFLDIVMKVRSDDTYNELNRHYYQLLQDNSDFKDIVNQLSLENYNCEFYPTPELAAFVKRGYKSYSEDHVEDEKKDRKKAIWYPIGVAFLTIIISTVINYFIYTNERDVNITNQKDTINIKVIPQNINNSLKIDTIESIDTLRTQKGVK